MVLIFGVTQR